jgi:hypothetical protein
VTFAPPSLTGGVSDRTERREPDAARGPPRPHHVLPQADLLRRLLALREVSNFSNVGF